MPFVWDALSLVQDIGTFRNASALRRARFTEVQGKMIEDRHIVEEDSIEVDILFEKDDEQSDDEATPDTLMSTSVSGTGVSKACLASWLASTPALQMYFEAVAHSCGA